MRFDKDEYVGDPEEEMLQKNKIISKHLDQYVSNHKARQRVAKKLLVKPIHGLTEMHEAGIVVNVAAAASEFGEGRKKYLLCFVLHQPLPSLFLYKCIPPSLYTNVPPSHLYSL